MKMLKTLLIFSLIIIGFALFLTLFEVITNKYIYLVNGICLLLVLLIKKKETGKRLGKDESLFVGRRAYS